MPLLCRGEVRPPRSDALLKDAKKEKYLLSCEDLTDDLAQMAMLTENEVAQLVDNSAWAATISLEAPRSEYPRPLSTFFLDTIRAARALNTF